MEKHVTETIKQLIPFLDFVKDHPATTKADQANATDVANIIENIETIGSTCSWCICFSVYSEKLIFFPIEGLYRYDWWVFMESGTLTIEAKREFYPFSPETMDFFFDYSYDFETGREYNPNGNDLSPFINDAINYKHYMTDVFTDIETEISNW